MVKKVRPFNLPSDDPQRISVLPVKVPRLTLRSLGGSPQAAIRRLLGAFRSMGWDGTDTALGIVKAMGTDKKREIGLTPQQAVRPSLSRPTLKVGGDMVSRAELLAVLERLAR